MGPTAPAIKEVGKLRPALGKVGGEALERGPTPVASGVPHELRNQTIHGIGCFDVQDVTDARKHVQW